MEDFFACHRVIYAMVIFVVVAVEVVVFEEEPSYIDVGMATHAKGVSRVARMEPFLNLQRHILSAVDPTAQIDVFGLMLEGKGVGLVGYEGVLA